MKRNDIVTTSEIPIIVFGTNFEVFLRSLQSNDILMNIVEWAPSEDNYDAYVTFTGRYDELIRFAMEEFEASSEGEAKEFLFG